MALNSPGTDDLGRAGVAGYVDNKFWLQMGSAFLTSYLIPTLAVKFTNLKNQSVSTTNSASTAGVTQTTSTGTVGSQQLQDSLNKFRDLSTQIVQNTFNTNPTITIDQGNYYQSLCKSRHYFPLLSLSIMD
jgi:type IV secretion system protein VirB10